MLSIQRNLMLVRFWSPCLVLLLCCCCLGRSHTHHRYPCWHSRGVQQIWYCEEDNDIWCKLFHQRSHKLLQLSECLFCFAQRHPEGIVSVAFKEFEAADSCVLQMNQRWYAGKQLQVGQWDGITNFQVEETDQEREERLSKWEKFFEEWRRWGEKRRHRTKG